MQLGSVEIFLKESRSVVHANGKDKPPTSLMFEKQQLKALYFNQSPSKVWCHNLDPGCWFFASHALDIYIDFFLLVNSKNSFILAQVLCPTLSFYF